MKNEVAGWTDESFMESNRGKMAVFFHAVQVQNNFKTAQEKRPIFQERIFLKSFAFSARARSLKLSETP